MVCKATLKRDLLQMKLEPTSNEIRGMTDFSENVTPPKSTKIGKLQFLGTTSKQTKISL